MNIWIINLQFIEYSQNLLSEIVKNIFVLILNQVFLKVLDITITKIINTHIKMPNNVVHRIIESDLNKIKNNKKLQDHLYLISQLLSAWSQMDILRINNIQLNIIMKECDIINYIIFRYMIIKQITTQNYLYKDTITYLNSKCSSINVIKK